MASAAFTCFRPIDPNCEHHQIAFHDYSSSHSAVERMLTVCTYGSFVQPCKVQPWGVTHIMSIASTRTTPAGLRESTTPAFLPFDTIVRCNIKRSFLLLGTRYCTVLRMRLAALEVLLVPKTNKAPKYVLYVGVCFILLHLWNYFMAVA